MKLNWFALYYCPLLSVMPNTAHHIKIRNLEFTANVRVSQTVSFVSIPTSDTAQPVPAYSATWEITANDPDKRPAKGDIIIAPDGTEWYVQKVTTVAHRNVWQCQTYTSITDFLSHETVNILRPFAAVSENGIATTAWRRIKSSISAKLISDDEQNLRAYHREHLPLQKHDIIELPDGLQYKISRSRNSRQTHGWTELFLAIKTDPVTVVEK